MDMSIFLFPLTFLLLGPTLSRACYIWGTDSGQCTDSSLDFEWRYKNMPYCQKAISFPVCIPQYQVANYNDYWFSVYVKRYAICS